MTLSDLIARCRNETQDFATPPLWREEEWIDFLNEAAEEACIRARLIEVDSLELDVSANDPHSPVPDYVWSIQRVSFGGQRLTLVDRQMLDSEGEAWEATTGTPRCCYEVGGKLRLFPIPDSDGTLSVHAFCIPSRLMSDDDDEPEGIKPRLQGKLTDWALHCAYSKKDADGFDANLAANYEAAFEKVFGPRPDEKAMRRLRINVRRYVKGAYF